MCKFIIHGFVYEPYNARGDTCEHLKATEKKGQESKIPKQNTNLTKTSKKRKY